jgi:hypothetical protein
MIRLLASFVPAAAAFAAEPHLEITAVSSPAATKNADGPSLATAADGTVWLTWLETDAQDDTALKVSRFDSRTRTWGAARTIAHQRDWVVNVFDAPQLVAQSGGRLTAVWSFAGSDGERNVETPRAFLSQSADGGATWSRPRLLTKESDNVEYVSLTALADGALLAAWIDGRSRKSDADPARLYARRVGGTEADTLLDERVCDCCRSSLTALPDDGALLTYRGRTKGEIRDVLSAKFHDGRWEAARTSTGELWRIEGCPVNGPRIANAELCVAQAWFTAEGDQPRVLAARSTDASGRFGEPQRIDLGHGGGRVDTLVLRDGTQLITWLESASADAGAPAAGLYLRQVSAAGEKSAPTLIAPVLNDAVGRVFPRIALVKDFDTTPAQILVAFTRPGATPHIETLLVPVPRTARSTSHPP